MKVVAIRYFLAKRDKLIDKNSEESLIDRAAQTETVDNESRVAAKIDMTRLLKNLPNRRYEYVIRRLILQEAEPQTVAKELATNVDNLYNIKKRAVLALTQSALKEIKKYDKKGNR